MKIRGPIFFSVVAIGLLIAAYYPKVNNAQKEAVLMHAVLTGLNQLHYKPVRVDDKFSEKVYDLYLERLDGAKRFLTQEDIAQLESFKYQIDDQAELGSFEFFDLSVELLQNGLDKTAQYYKEILASPFDFTQEETIQMDGEKRAFEANDAALKDYWRRYLKYETLSRVNDALEEQEQAGEEQEKKSVEVLEQEAREDILELFDNWFERLNRLDRDDRLSYYINAMTGIFDPHTNYYKPKDKEEFNIRFSGRLEGIGARLSSDGDFTKVVDVVVGGPAWQGKELEKDDLIRKVAQDGEEPVDIKGMILDDVVQLIRGKKGTIVRLTIEKVDGTVQEIAITRDIVQLEDRWAKSLIFDGKTEGERVGYIYLPSFYADFQDRNGRFSSIDVEKEIEKLKAENVDAIILDLRDNGGGSLRDVVKMGGFFIESGPVVQVKGRANPAKILRDVDPRVQYDGPLVVMVNENSASASEILAAALQDYGRAVIVGSKSTFGKGTVQSFFDLDRTVNGYSEIKPLGDLKLTYQKFYRINGGSVQLRGVIPDIILPDNFHYFTMGEKRNDYAMEWTEIEPTQYGQEVMRIQNIEELKRRSEERIADNKTFKKILENAKRLKEQRDQSSYPLSLEAYQSVEQKRNAEAKRFNDLFDQKVNNGIYNLEVDLPAIDIDESRKARNEDWIKTISKDIYLKETINIVHDMLTMGN
jgi:carboxyl-terminal processing protease